MKRIWIQAAPDLPRREPMTSMAAFPLTFDSWSNGMKAISLVESKKVYFIVLLMLFWKAPKRTIAMRGVKSARGPSRSRKRKRERKIRLETPTTMGVTWAEKCHPRRRTTTPLKKRETTSEITPMAEPMEAIKA